MNFNTFISFIAVFFLISCTHKPISNEFLSQIQVQNLKVSNEFDFSSADALKRKIQSLGPLNINRKQDQFIRLLLAFRRLTVEIKNNQIELLPHSKTTVKLNSFCGSAQSAVPQYNEVFRWVKGPGPIPYSKNLISYYNQTAHAEQRDIQQILWNLDNKTYYEDYPQDLKALLNKAIPSAQLVLPSKLKNKMLDEILPSQVQENIALIKGQYHSFDEFKSYLEKQQSTQSIPSDYYAAKIPATELTVRTISNGFESQSISFYNPTGKQIKIGLTDFYFQPVRSDVQPILLASFVPDLDEMQKILEQQSLELLGYLGAQYPTLNSSEKELVKERPIDAAIVYYDAMIAERNADQIFPNSSHNGKLMLSDISYGQEC